MYPSADPEALLEEGKGHMRHSPGSVLRSRGLPLKIQAKRGRSLGLFQVNKKLILVGCLSGRCAGREDLEGGWTGAGAGGLGSGSVIT